MNKGELDYITEEILMKIYKISLCMQCEEIWSNGDRVIIPTPIDEPNSAYRTLTGENGNGKVYVIDGKVEETNLGDCLIKCEWINPQISVEGIRYIEGKHDILKQISPREKLDILECIDNCNKIFHHVDIANDDSEFESDILDVLTSIVREADLWLQQRNLQQRNIVRVYSSETENAKLIFTYNFKKIYERFTGKLSNGKERKSNGIYLNAGTVCQNCVDINSPVIIINLSKVLSDLGIDSINGFSGYAKVWLTSIVVHEVSHFYDDATLPNSLWEQMDKEKKVKLLRFLELFTEFKSKYYQELYYFENIDAKMRMKYVENELERIKCDLSKCIPTYDLMHKVAQVICWKENIVLINVIRKDNVCLNTMISDLAKDIMQRKHSKIFLKMIHNERTKEKVMWRLSRLINV